VPGLVRRGGVLNRIAGLALLLVGGATGASAQGTGTHPLPPLPWERPGLSCGAYCGAEWSTCRSVPLFDAPRPGAAVVAWIPPHEELEVTEGRIVVESPGVVVFRDTTRPPRIPSQAGIPPVPDTLRFVPGDTLYVLDRETDGDGVGVWHLYFRGAPLVSEYPFWEEAGYADGDAPAVLVRSPGATEWVHVQRSAAVGGWVVNVPGAFAGTAPYYTGGPELCAARP
jgi:hypothetical protein